MRAGAIDCLSTHLDSKLLSTNLIRCINQVRPDITAHQSKSVLDTELSMSEGLGILVCLVVMSYTAYRSYQYIKPCFVPAPIIKSSFDKKSELRGVVQKIEDYESDSDISDELEQKINRYSEKHQCPISHSIMTEPVLIALSAY